MLREIKFRALYKGNFVYGNLIQGLYEGKPFTEIEHSDSTDFSKYQVDRNTVGQFTGFLDKNGVEIYEGDIIQMDEYSTFQNTCKGVVSFLNGCFVSLYGQDAYGRDQFDNINTINESREVIGNIHEHKYLL